MQKLQLVHQWLMHHLENGLCHGCRLVVQSLWLLEKLTEEGCSQDAAQSAVKCIVYWSNVGQASLPSLKWLHVWKKQWLQLPKSLFC